MLIAHVPEECRADYQEARARSARFLAALRHDDEARRRERTAGHRLALEWAGLIAITYLLIFGGLAPWLKAVLLVPWSIYVGLALDNITHYANHWPLFRGRAANALWRWSGALVLFNPSEIKHVHAEHHRAYSRPDGDERVFGAEDRGKSYLVYLFTGLLSGAWLLVPWRKLPECVVALRTTRPGEYREIVLLRWAFLLLFALLLAADASDTLLFFLPGVVLTGSFASLVMNMTDHVPGDPRHPFRLATFLEPRSRAEEALSAINHHTAATHLTHHLFPQAHWTHLRALQRDLAPLYERNRAPRSLLINSTLVGNPLRLALLLAQVGRRRFDSL